MWLVDRDLSMNKLVGGYNRIREGLCTGVTCPLMSMYVIVWLTYGCLLLVFHELTCLCPFFSNMTGNRFSGIPENVFFLPNLQYLYVRPIIPLELLPSCLF